MRRFVIFFKDCLKLVKEMYMWKKTGAWSGGGAIQLLTQNNHLPEFKSAYHCQVLINYQCPLGIFTFLCPHINLSATPVDVRCNLVIFGIAAETYQILLLVHVIYKCYGFIFYILIWSILVIQFFVLINFNLCAFKILRF